MPSYEAGAAAHRQTRQANERLVRAIETIVPEDREVPFLCECVDPLCTEAIPMTLKEFWEVRSQPRRFAIAPGHEQAAGERVVRENKRFHLLEVPDDSS